MDSDQDCEGGPLSDYSAASELLFLDDDDDGQRRRPTATAWSTHRGRAAGPLAQRRGNRRGYGRNAGRSGPRGPRSGRADGKGGAAAAPAAAATAATSVAAAAAAVAKAAAPAKPRRKRRAFHHHAAAAAAGTDDEAQSSTNEAAYGDSGGAGDGRRRGATYAHRRFSSSVDLGSSSSTVGTPSEGGGGGDAPTMAASAAGGGQRNGIFASDSEVVTSSSSALRRNNTVPGGCRAPLARRRPSAVTRTRSASGTSRQRQFHAQTQAQAQHQQPQPQPQQQQQQQNQAHHHASSGKVQRSNSFGYFCPPSAGHGNAFGGGGGAAADRGGDRPPSWITGGTENVHPNSSLYGTPFDGGYHHHRSYYAESSPEDVGSSSKRKKNLHGERERPTVAIFQAGMFGNGNSGCGGDRPISPAFSSHSTNSFSSLAARSERGVGLASSFRRYKSDVADETTTPRPSPTEIVVAAAAAAGGGDAAAPPPSPPAIDLDLDDLVPYSPPPSRGGDTPRGRAGVDGGNGGGSARKRRGVCSSPLSFDVDVDVGGVGGRDGDHRGGGDGDPGGTAMSLDVSSSTDTCSRSLHSQASCSTTSMSVPSASRPRPGGGGCAGSGGGGGGGRTGTVMQFDLCAAEKKVGSAAGGGRRRGTQTSAAGASSSSSSTARMAAPGDMDDDDAIFQPPVPRRRSSVHFDAVFASGRREFDAEIVAVADRASPRPPHRPRRTAGAATTPMATAAVAAAGAASSEDAREAAMMASIPSNRDLVFLLRQLREADKKRRGRGALSFSSTTCTVIPPQMWKSDRKGKFLSWATKSLGFSLRNAGAGVDYLVISSERGAQIQGFLESALLARKELRLAERRQRQREVHGELQEQPQRSEQMPMYEVPSRVEVPPSRVPQRYVNVNATCEASFGDVGAMDLEILPNFDLLKISDDQQPSHSDDKEGGAEVAHVQNPSSADHDISAVEMLSPGKRLPHETDRSHDDGSNLDPETALETSYAQLSLASASMASRKRDSSISPPKEETSFELSRLSRFSGEHSLAGQDFLLHCHGVSPRMTTNGSGAVRPRALRPVPSIRTGCPGRAGGPSEGADEVSPLPPLPSRGPLHAVASAMSESVDGISPLPQHDVQPIGIPAAKDADLVETPMLKRQTNFCGLQYVNGKDWGKSMKCHGSIILALQNRLEEAQCQIRDSKEEDLVQHVSPSNRPTLSVNSYTVESVTSGSKLGFDDEASSTRSSKSPSVDLQHEVDEDDDLVDMEDDFIVDMADGKRRRSFSANSHTSDGGKQWGQRRASLPNLVRNTFLQHQKKFGGRTLPGGRERRQQISREKHQRMSISAASLDVLVPRRFTMMNSRPFRSSVAPTSLTLARIASNNAHFALNNNAAAGEANLEAVIESQLESQLTLTPAQEHAQSTCFSKDEVLSTIFDFASEEELLCCLSLVCTDWANASTNSLAKIMLISVGCSTSIITGADADDDGDDSDDEGSTSSSLVYDQSPAQNSIAKSMERSWTYLNGRFPWATFLSEGCFKQVYRVWNSSVGAEEAISVMDVNLIESTGNKAVVGAELAVSVLLSSLARRNICPNFVITRGVFTCSFAPPPSHWGSAENKAPRGKHYDASSRLRKPRRPNANRSGRYQYIRMELCCHGDVEDFISKQPGKSIDVIEARCLLFQMAFSLHTASDRYGMKHYDVKLLNFFLQSANDGTIDENCHPHTVLRYGLGEHIFRLRMATSRDLLVKLADYGTANLRPESNGQQVTLGQFTTLENTPPEQLFLGDAAVQGFGHDLFGLGLCMLHLFTGEAPYEEILEEVTCPPTLKKNLRKLWESRSLRGFSVIRSVILANVYEDADGTVEGEVDDTLYDTLYRYLVLFGIPDEDNWLKSKEGKKVMKAIASSLGDRQDERRRGTGRRAKQKGTMTSAPDLPKFDSDRSRYSLALGSDKRIAAARKKLSGMEGGMHLLLSLVAFDPDKRIGALDVLNSTFMAPLREIGEHESDPTDIVYSYTSYLTRPGNH